jgi:hypothetical protein
MFRDRTVSKGTPKQRGIPFDFQHIVPLYALSFWLDIKNLFSFKNSQGVDSMMLISGEGKKFTAVSITGEHPSAAVIIDSLKAK